MWSWWIVALPLNGAAFVVALPADERHLERRRPASAGPSPPGCRGCRGRSVQRGASGSPRAIALPCSERRVLLRLLVVAAPAVHLPARAPRAAAPCPARSAWQFDALQAAVDRRRERLLGHVERDRAALPLGGEVLLAVAGEAVGVLLRARRGGREQDEDDGKAGQPERVARRCRPRCVQTSAPSPRRRVGHAPCGRARLNGASRRARLDGSGPARSIDHSIWFDWIEATAAPGQDWVTRGRSD